MDHERPELSRLDVLKALKVSNAEAVFATVHTTLTGGAFQTGYALMLGANNLWMGVLSSFPTFAGLAQIVSSYIIEQRGERKRFTAWTTGFGRMLWLPILLLAFLPPGHSQQARFRAFLALLLLSSVALSVAVPAFTSWMADLVPPDYRGRYFGRRNMLAGITTMAVSLPAAWFLDLATKHHRFAAPIGFGTLFFVGVLGGIGSFVCLMRQAEPPMRRSPDCGARGLRAIAEFYRPPFGDAAFRRFMVYSGIFAFAQFFAAPFYIVYALEVLRLNYVWLQVFATLSSLAGLLSMPLWGYLGDKFGSRPLLAIANFGVALLPLIWCATSPRFITASIIVVCINNLLGGAFWAGVGLTQFNLLIGVSPGERKSVYVGATSAVTGLMGGLAPICGGAAVTALNGVVVRPLGWQMDNYLLVFAANAMLRFGALLALRGVSDPGSHAARSVLARIGPAPLGALMKIRRMQRAQGPDDRRAAMQAIRSTRATLAVEELTAALDDPSLAVREEAAEALGEMGDWRAAEALIAHLGDPASGIVDEAAEALGRLGDERAVDPLGSLLAGRDGNHGRSPAPDRSSRLAAARALGRIGSERALPYLLDAMCRSDESEDVREICAAALGEIGAPEAAPALMEQLGSPHRALSLASIRALGDIGEPAACGPLLNLLRQSSGDDEVTAQVAAALPLVAADAREATGALLDALDRVTSPIARKQALHAVGTLLGDGDAYYAVVALDGFARDDAVARAVADMRRRIAHSSRTGRSRFGAQRQRVELERSLERYNLGDYGGAARLLAALTSARSDDPAALALAWSARTADRRSLLPEEFLLALFAARRALAGATSRVPSNTSPSSPR